MRELNGTIAGLKMVGTLADGKLFCCCPATCCLYPAEFVDSVFWDSYPETLKYGDVILTKGAYDEENPSFVFYTGEGITIYIEYDMSGNRWRMTSPNGDYFALCLIGDYPALEGQYYSHNPEVPFETIIDQFEARYIVPAGTSGSVNFSHSEEDPNFGSFTTDSDAELERESLCVWIARDVPVSTWFRDCFFSFTVTLRLDFSMPAFLTDVAAIWRLQAEQQGSTIRVCEGLSVTLEAGYFIAEHEAPKSSPDGMYIGEFGAEIVVSASGLSFSAAPNTQYLPIL